MAKPKTNLVIKVSELSGYIDVWCIDTQSVIGEISRIEGVVKVYIMVHDGHLSVSTSPLYDVNEIAQEIKELLSSEVPDVFKEE